MGLPWWHSSKESTCQWWRHRFDPWFGKIPCAMEQLNLCLHHWQVDSLLLCHQGSPNFFFYYFYTLSHSLNGSPNIKVIIEFIELQNLNFTFLLMATGVLTTFIFKSIFLRDLRYFLYHKLNAHEYLDMLFYFTLLFCLFTSIQHCFN